MDEGISTSGDIETLLDLLQTASSVGLAPSSELVRVREAGDLTDIWLLNGTHSKRVCRAASFEIEPGQVQQVLQSNALGQSNKAW